MYRSLRVSLTQTRRSSRPAVDRDPHTGVPFPPPPPGSASEPGLFHHRLARVVAPSGVFWGERASTAGGYWNVPLMRNKLDKYFTPPLSHSSEKITWAAERSFPGPRTKNTDIPLSPLEVLFSFYQRGVISAA